MKQIYIITRRKKWDNFQSSFVTQYLLVCEEEGAFSLYLKKNGAFIGRKSQKDHFYPAKVRVNLDSKDKKI